MRTIPTYLMIGILSLVAPAWAETLYSPDVCAGQGSLKLTNLTAKERVVTLRFRDEAGVYNERVLGLPPRATETYSPEDLPSYSLSLSVPDASVLAFQTCGSESYPWSPKTSPRRNWILKTGLPHKIYVQNLHPRPQTVMLRFLTSTRRTVEIQNVQLGPYLKTSIAKFVPTATELEIQSEGRISVQLTRYESQKLKPVAEGLSTPVKVKVDPQAAYFLMLSSDNQDSFVVKLTDPALISQARDIVRQGIFKLMVADIGLQSRSENRSLLKGDKSPYSWAVEKVLGFNDFAHVSCNGFPQGVEDKIFERLQSKRICFWDYRLGRELSPSEVQSGQLLF